MLLADSVTEESLFCSFVFKQPRQQEKKDNQPKTVGKEMCHFSYSHKSLMGCSLCLLFCVNRSDFISTWLVFYIFFFKNNQTQVLLLKLSHNGHQHLGIQVSKMSLLGSLLNDVCLSYHLWALSLRHVGCLASNFSWCCRRKKLPLNSVLVFWCLT